MKKRNLIKNHPVIFSFIFLFIIGFLILSFWSVEDTFFSFNYKTTGEKIEGDVYFDNEFFGFAEKGEIKVPYIEDLPEEITFKGEYNGTEFELLYDFPLDYLDYSEIPFLISQEEINNFPLLEDIIDNFQEVNFSHWGIYASNLFY